MKEEQYNGWKNYNTWRVHLEIFDNLDFKEDKETPTPLECMEYALEVISDGANPLALEYATLFLCDVDWAEIAKALHDKWNESNVLNAS
tara:strand:+ start:91 stop:357 length:267 start_codon:yes stop_codon:yes gene_type:complete